jgi:hypothetical protein
MSWFEAGSCLRTLPRPQVSAEGRKADRVGGYDKARIWHFWLTIEQGEGASPLASPSARPGMTYKLDSGTGRCRGDQFSDRVRL